MPDQVPLGGSRRPAPSAPRVRDVDPAERFDVTVTLAGPPLPDPAAGEPMTREQFEREHGADPETIRRVSEALERLGLIIEESSPLTRSLRVSGTAAQLEAAFRPGLGVYDHPEQGQFRGRAGELQIPAELEGLITGVFGLDERRVARRRRAASAPDWDRAASWEHPASSPAPGTDRSASSPAPGTERSASSPAPGTERSASSPAPDTGGVLGSEDPKPLPSAAGGGLVQARAAAGQALTPAQLAAHYAFPAGDGSGQTVAIAEFGGGYFASDLEAFCARQGTPVPKVSTVGVNGTPVLTLAQIQALPAQQRQQQLDESVEVNMDVQIVAGLAPGADQVVYFSSFDEQGWVDLLGDVIAGKPAPAVALSISWGLAEDDPSWSAAARQAIDERLQAAAALGITVCVAAGDDGSADQINDGRAHVDFPASSPHALAVGGTMLSGDADVTWWESPGERTGSGGGATGGGVSTVFARPSWQDVRIASLNPGAIDGRVIPDVAALAGPPFYDLVFIGQDQPNGGTSAATPLWAALIARLAGSAQRPWKPRFLAPLLYGSPAVGSPAATVGAAGCTDVTSGDNTSSTLGRGYSAGPGFDAVSGWGVPNGSALLAALAP